MADEANESINIIVKNGAGEELHFKVKRTTKFKKILTAYCAKRALEEKEVRFTFDGERIQEDATPQSLGMEDGDVVDAFATQIGGC